MKRLFFISICFIAFYSSIALGYYSDTQYDIAQKVKQKIDATYTDKEKHKLGSIFLHAIKKNSKYKNVFEILLLLYSSDLNKCLLSNTYDKCSSKNLVTDFSPHGFQDYSVLSNLFKEVVDLEKSNIYDISKYSGKPEMTEKSVILSKCFVLPYTLLKEFVDDMKNKNYQKIIKMFDDMKKNNIDLFISPTDLIIENSSANVSHGYLKSGNKINGICSLFFSCNSSVNCSHKLTVLTYNSGNILIDAYRGKGFNLSKTDFINENNLFLSSYKEEVNYRDEINNISKNVGCVFE